MARGNYKNVQEFGRYSRGNNFAWTIPKEINQEVNPEDYAIVAYEKSNCNNNWNKTFDDEYTHVVVTNDTTAKTNNYMSGEKKIYINGQLYDTKYVKNHERGTTFDKSLASAINKYNHMRFGKTVKDHFEEEYTALKFVNYYDKALTTSEVANVFKDRHRETNEIIPVEYQKYYDFRKVTITGNSGVADNLIFHNGDKGTIEYTESDIFELSREDGFSALNDQNVDSTTFLGSGNPVIRSRVDLEPFAFGGADFTFEFTLRFDPLRGSRSDERIIYFKGSNSVIFKRDGSNKRLELVFENSATGQSIKYTTGDCIINDVMHVVVVYDYSSTTDVKIYIDGTSQTITRSVTGSAGNDSTIFQSATRTNHYIGSDTGMYTGFTMKYLKYYSSALSSVNVADLYSLYSNDVFQRYPYPNILEFDFRSASIRSGKIISKNKKIGTPCGVNASTIQITKSGEYLPVRISEYVETLSRSFGSATGEIPQSTDTTLSTGDGRTVFCRFMIPYGISAAWPSTPSILKKNSSIISLNSKHFFANFDISGYSGTGDVQDTSGNDYDGSLVNGNPGSNNGNSAYPPTFVAASGSTPAHFQLRDRSMIRFDTGTNKLGVDFEIKIKFSIPDSHPNSSYEFLLTGNEYRANYGLSVMLYDRRPQLYVSTNTGYSWSFIVPTTGASAAAQIPRNTITELTLKHNSSGFFLLIDGVHVAGGPNLNYGSYSDNSTIWTIAGDETNFGPNNWSGHYDIYDVSFTKGPTTKIGATIQNKNSKYYIVPSIGLDLQDSAYADYHFDYSNVTTGSYTENQTKSEPKFEYEEEKWYTLAITTQFTEVSGGSNYIDNTMYINGVKQGDTYRIENNSNFTPSDLADKVMGWVGSSQRYDTITLGKGHISEFIKIMVSDGAYFDYALTAAQVAALSTGDNPNSSYISGLSSTLAPKWYQRTDGPGIQASGGIIDYLDQRISLGRHFIPREHTVEFSVRIHEDQLGNLLFLSDTSVTAPYYSVAWQRLIQYNLMNDHVRRGHSEYGNNSSLAMSLEMMKATNGTIQLQIWGWHPDSGYYASGSFNIGNLNLSQDQHFFIEMISNTHIKIYLNNSLIRTQTWTDTNDRLDNRTTKYNVVLGSIHAPEYDHSGIFEYKYTRIYDRVLQKEERDTLYNSRNTSDIFSPSSLIKEYSKEVKNFDGSLATYTRKAKAEENYITPFDKKRQGFLINENYLTETNIPVSSNYSIEMAIRESDLLGGIYHDTDETLLHFHTKTGENVDNTNQLQIRYKPDTDKLNIWYGNNDSHHVEVTETDYNLKDYIEPYYEFDFRKATKDNSNTFYTFEDGTTAYVVNATTTGLLSFSYGTYTKPSSITDSDTGICTEISSTRKPLQIIFNKSKEEELKLHTNFSWEMVYCMNSNKFNLTSHHSWTYIMEWVGHVNGFLGEGTNFGKNLLHFAIVRKSNTSKLMVTLYMKEITASSHRYENFIKTWDSVRYRTVEDVVEMFETCHIVATYDSSVKFQHGNETYQDGEARNSPIKLLINGKNYDLMVDEDALTHNNIDLKRHTDRGNFSGALYLGGTNFWGEWQGGDMLTYVNYYNKTLTNQGCRTLYQRYISSLKPVIDYDFRKCSLSNYRLNFEDGKYVDFEGQPYSFDFCRQDEFDGIHLEGHSSLRLPPPPKIGRDFTIEFVGNVEFIPGGTNDSKVYSIFGFNNYGDDFHSIEENWKFNQTINFEDGSGNVITQTISSHSGNLEADEYFHIVRPNSGKYIYIVYKPRGNPGGNGGDEHYAWYSTSRTVEKIFTGDWCHIVFVYTQAQAPRLYVNGELAVLNSGYSKQRGVGITEYPGANYKTFRPRQQNIILGHGIMGAYSSSRLPTEIPKMNFRYIKMHNVGFDRQHCLRLYEQYQYENYKLMNKRLKHVVLTINSDTLTGDANAEHELSVDKQKREAIKLYVDGNRKELVYDVFPETPTALSNVTRELLVGAGLDSSGNKVLSKLDSSLAGFNTFNKELTELEIRELYTKHTKTNIEDYKADKMDKKECRETLLRPVEAYDFRKIKSMKAGDITLENDRTIQAYRYEQNARIGTESAEDVSYNTNQNYSDSIYLGRPAQPLHEFDFRNSYNVTTSTSRNLYLKNSIFQVDAGNGWNNVTIPSDNFKGIITPGGIIGEGFELHKQHTIEVYFRRKEHWLGGGTASFNVFNFTDFQGGKYSLQCGTVTSSTVTLGTSIKIENTFGSTKSITLEDNYGSHTNGNYGVLCHIVIVIDTENNDNISIYTNGVKNNYNLDFEGDSLCDMPLHKRDKLEFGSSWGSQVRENTTASKEIKYLRYYDKCLVHAEIVDLYRAREHNYEHGMSIEIDNKQGLTISEAVDGNQEDRMFVTSTNTPHYTGGSFTAEFTINSVDLDISPRRDQIYFSYSDSITGYEGTNSSGPQRETIQSHTAQGSNGSAAGRTLALCGKITDTNHITGGMNANTKEGTLGFYLEDPSKTYSTTAPGTGGAIKAYMPSNQYGPHTNVINSGWIHLAMSHDDDVIHQNDSFQTGLQGVRYYLNGEEITDKFERLYYTSETGAHVALGPKIKDRFLKIGKSDFDPQAQESFRTTMFRYYDRVLNPDEIKQKYTDYIKTDPYNFTNYNISENFNSAISGNKSYAQRSDNGLDNYKLSGFNSLREKCEVNYKIDKDLPDDVVGENKYAFEINPKGLGTSSDLSIQDYETPATNNTATHMDWTFCANNSTDSFHEFLRLRSGSNGGTIQANTANSTSTPSWADIQVTSGAYWSDDRLKYGEQLINHQESLNKIMKLTGKNYINVQRIMTKEQEEEFENGGNPFSNNPHLNRFNEDGFIAQDLLQHTDLHELVVQGDKCIPHKVKYNDILCLGLSSIKAMDINKNSTMNKLQYISRRIR